MRGCWHQRQSGTLQERERSLYTQGRRLSGGSSTASYRGADKSLARPGRKQAAATEDFEFNIPYL